MSSVFRIYDFKVCFYGYPDDKFYIEYGDLTFVMDNARYCRTYIENNIQSAPRVVYKFILLKLKNSGYNMALFEDGGPTYSLSEIEKWYGSHTPRNNKELSAELERAATLKSLESNFWGNILVGGLFDARY